MFSNITAIHPHKPAMAAETNGRPVDPSITEGKPNGHVVVRRTPTTKNSPSRSASRSFSIVTRSVTRYDL